MSVVYLSDVQRAKAEKGDAMGAMVVELFQNECDPAALLPWKTIGTTEIRNKVTDSIASPTWRQGRGQRFGAATKPAFNTVADAIWSLGVEIDIDKTDYKDKLAGNLVEDIVRYNIEGLAWVFKDAFINGDHATNAHMLEGLKVRLANMPAANIVYGETSALELDLRPNAFPAEAEMYQFLDRIDATIDALDGNTGDAVFTDQDFIAVLRGVLRRLGKYTERPIDSPNFIGANRRKTDADKVNKPVLIYPEDKGLKWYNMGYKADQSTRVIGTETVNGVACRPAYFVKFGEKYVHGIQQYAMDVDGPTLLDDRVTYRTVVDWPIGLHHVHNRSIAKLAGVRVAD
jgi:hypothetical protein